VPLISLIGMPGGGKSTVGRQLARRLGTDLFDIDQMVEHKVGCAIKQFFEREGEARFRDVESSILMDVTAKARGVMATGGGAVLREANRDALRARTVAVYLHSSPEELFRRLRHDTKRPLLQVGDPLARLRELHAQRDPLYREVAHFVIETGRPALSTLVNMILMQLELAGHIDPASIPSVVDGPLCRE
jgi:shikimate kinase